MARQSSANKTPRPKSRGPVGRNTPPRQSVYVPRKANCTAPKTLVDDLERAARIRMAQ